MLGYHSAVVVAGVVAMAAVGGSSRTGADSALVRAPITCEQFRAEGRIIDVGPDGGTFDFGYNHRVVFPAGALSVAARYNVVALPAAGGQQLAALMIVPLAGAPRTFPAPLLVRIGYGDCAVAPDAPPLHIDTRANNGDPWQPIGGGDWRAQRWVEGFTNHLSAFAIAN